MKGTSTCNEVHTMRLLLCRPFFSPMNVGVYRSDVCRAVYVMEKPNPQDFLGKQFSIGR